MNPINWHLNKQKLLAALGHRNFLNRQSVFLVASFNFGRLQNIHFQHEQDTV